LKITQAAITTPITPLSTDYVPIGRVGALVPQAVSIEQIAGFRASRVNLVLNSGFDIADQGVSQALTTTLVHKSLAGWAFFQQTAAAGIAEQITNAAIIALGQRYAARIARTAGSALTGPIAAAHVVETADSVRLAGKVATFSFWAKAGANFSAAGANMMAQLSYGTGVDQGAHLGFGGAFGWTGQVNLVVSPKALTAAWQRFTFTFNVPATATQLGFVLYFTPTGVAGADDSLQLTGVRLHEGGDITNWSGDQPIAIELLHCQRRYRKSYPQGVAPGTASADGYEFAAATANVPNAADFAQVNFPVMRAAPTMRIWSYLGTLGRVSESGGGTDLVAGSGGTSSITDRRARIRNASGGAIAPTAGGFAFHWDADANLN
jgi:hypothetical protein